MATSTSGHSSRRSLLCRTVAFTLAATILPAAAAAQRVSIGRTGGDGKEGDQGVTLRRIELRVPCTEGCRFTFSLSAEIGSDTPDFYLDSVDPSSMVVANQADEQPSLPNQYQVTVSRGPTPGDDSGSVSVFLTVAVIGDTDVEADERIEVQVADLKQPDSPALYTLRAGIIRNDDLDDAGGPSGALAERGSLIAQRNPLTAMLITQELSQDFLRGLYIGLAAAEGQTLWGPGKQRILDSLPVPQQHGFRTGAFFSLDRNRNVELAKVGATIAEADSVVASARTAEGDVRYWLGFDIASGIFGNPALGGRGNTQTGPGSLGIRDALSMAAQRGFNAAVTLHLSRRYLPLAPKVPTASPGAAVQSLPH